MTGGAGVPPGPTVSTRVTRRVRCPTSRPEGADGPSTLPLVVVPRPPGSLGTLARETTMVLRVPVDGKVS